MWNSPYFFFDSKELQSLAQRHHEAYVKADPYPSIAIDDFLPPEVLDKVLEEFPEPNGEWDQRYDRGDEKSKLEISADERMGPFTRHLLSQLNSAAFLRFLETLTGIQGLIPDPHFSGCGLHQTVRGGYLNIHADFNWNEKLDLDRRVNSLIYLNKDWKDEYNGHLELWDRRMKRCVQRIAPIFNRLAVFSPTSTSWHGHPDLLACPPGQSRKSIAAFYYTNGRPFKERRPHHSTIWRARPGDAPVGTVKTLAGQ